MVGWPAEGPSWEVLERKEWAILEGGDMLGEMDTVDGSYIADDRVSRLSFFNLSGSAFPPQHRSECNATVKRGVQRIAGHWPVCMTARLLHPQRFDTKFSEEWQNVQIYDWLRAVEERCGAFCHQPQRGNHSMPEAAAHIVGVDGAGGVIGAPGLLCGFKAQTVQ